MQSIDKEKIQQVICPLINNGEISLLLGAGFSLVNINKQGIQLPNGDGLKEILLKKCEKQGSPKTTLKDAYSLAVRSVPAFEDFFRSCFSVDKAELWQEKIFQYVWNRIYTTNIDNVLDVALQQAQAKRRASAEFKFFNYTETQLANNAIGEVPVVTIHGTINRQSDGYIFSNLEYAKATSSILDWHNELAAKIMIGGLVVIGNQLDEADIDSHIAARAKIYDVKAGGKNWIVMPDPDEIKRENYQAAGFDVIDATAEDFFNCVYEHLPSRTIGDLLLEKVPSLKVEKVNIKAMSWFRAAFNSVTHEIERAKSTSGILRHFISGAEPEWFYITNSANALTSKISELLTLLGSSLQSASHGISIVNVTGPSGSGKTTAIRTALHELVKTYNYIYEFQSSNGIDVELLYEIVNSFSGKSVIVFYSAAEYYYAVNAIATKFKDKKNPHCLFILEDRVSEYKKSRHQLSSCKSMSVNFEMGNLTIDDALSIAQKIEEHGQNFENFSEFPIRERARLIVNKERGYGGDLLSALFSLTTHANFEKKIHQDFHSVSNELAKNALEVVVIMNYLGFPIPIDYAAGFLNVRVEQLIKCLNEDLSGIVNFRMGTSKLTCRHRIISEYYFKNCIAGQGSVEFVSQILNYLSRQFTIDDIKHHPLAYLIYKNIISFNFLYDKYFPANSRDADTEKTYHEAQKVYGKDGVFWLHFGRFYRKTGRLDEAIDCFRTGLSHYDSFQTRHSLGTVLIEKYIEDECDDEAVYEEGVFILENERMSRGTTDPYPTSTMTDLLLKVLKFKPDHKDAVPRVKQCINYGIQHFKGDAVFEEKMKQFLAIMKVSN